MKSEQEVREAMELIETGQWDEIDSYYVKHMDDGSATVVHSMLNWILQDDD